MCARERTHSRSTNEVFCWRLYPIMSVSEELQRIMMNLKIALALSLSHTRRCHSPLVSRYSKIVFNASHRNFTAVVFNSHISHTRQIYFVIWRDERWHMCKYEIRINWNWYRCRLRTSRERECRKKHFLGDAEWIS